KLAALANMAGELARIVRHLAHERPGEGVAGTAWSAPSCCPGHLKAIRRQSSFNGKSALRPRPRGRGQFQQAALGAAHRFSAEAGVPSVTRRAAMPGPA